ncbi:unnamed protein product, partial [Rotaria sp. Silwood1]
MAPPSKRRLQLSAVSKKRLSTSYLNTQINNTSSGEESDMEIDDYNDEEPSNCKSKFTIGNIADLFELCRAQCPLKYLSVLLYMSLRHFGVSWNDCDGFLRDIGSLKAQTAHKWSQTFMSGDFDEFQGENRGGHERSDVIEHRQQFIDYFLDQKDYYYRVSNDDKPVWTLPTQSPPCILLFHDESTFRSGEVCSKRWFFGKEAPFHSKGKGRSNMVSDFMVQHPSGPFFSLSKSEYEKALVKYPQLANDTGITYVERTATGSINVGQDSYFDNATILEQFERLFQLLEFKEEYKDHVIECVVDNARTHSAKSHSLLDFGKSIGTRCPVDRIEYTDAQGQKQILNCYFQGGPNHGMSKGLLYLAKELQIQVPSKIRLEDLRVLLSDHPAFKTVSRLEQLAAKYGVTIKFCPKFHCELNCIEGLWCSQKMYVRRKTDQTYTTMLKLIVESRENFRDKEIHLKLFRRFWKCLLAYKDGQSYAK